MKAEAARIQALRKPRPRSRFAGMGYGAICEILREEQQLKRRGKRKRRAA